MNHVIILDTTNIIVIAVCWIIGTFVSGFIKAAYDDHFDAKHNKRIDEMRRKQKLN